MIPGLIIYSLIVLWVIYEIRHPYNPTTELSEEHSFEVDKDGNLIEVITAKFQEV